MANGEWQRASTVRNCHLDLLPLRGAFLWWDIQASRGGRETILASDKSWYPSFSRKLSQTVPVLSRLLLCLETIYHNLCYSIREPPRENCLLGGGTVL